MCKFYVYLNPKAPQHIKDFVAEHFSDGTRVSAVFMQEMTGGLADEGPALFNYAAAFIQRFERDRAPWIELAAGLAALIVVVVSLLAAGEVDAG